MVLPWLFAAGSDLFLGARCAGCGGQARLLCEACAAQLRGRPRSARPDPCPPGLPPSRVVAAYAGPVASMLAAHKDGGRLALARPLGAALARAAAAVAGCGQAGPPLLLIPVPSRPAATRRRGHDPMLRTARYAAATLRANGRRAAVVPALGHTRAVQDQAGLGHRERAANLAGALRARPVAAPLLTGGIAVVVDDVMTTGATLAEASAALARAGAQPAGVAAIAATSRRGPTVSRPSRND